MNAERIEKIKNSIPDKMFFDSCFEGNDRNKILQDIEFVYKGSSESNILNCHPILKKDQEYHLFRKFNYLKYRLIKLTIGFKKSDENPSPKPSKSVNLLRLKEKSLLEIESLISKIQETRNIIIKANMRLVVRPIYKYASEDSFHREEFFSNAYFHMFRAIDCFDFRRNFKFSTYFVNCLHTNLGRDYYLHKRHDDLLCLPEEPIVSKEKDQFSEINAEYNKEFIKKMLDILGKMKNSKSHVLVLKKYFGIDCDRLMLHEIGKELNLSKERVRQIKLQSLQYLNRNALVYDPLM